MDEIKTKVYKYKKSLNNEINTMLEKDRGIVEATERLDYRISKDLTNQLINTPILENLSPNLLFNQKYSILLKKSERFFCNKFGEEVIDTISFKWSPKFYKIWNALDTLVPLLSNSKVLDPFAGSGLFSYYFLASGIISKLHLNDISYPFNKPIYQNNYYHPIRNIESIVKLSSGAIPNKVSDITISSHHIKDIKVADFDYIFTDPPLHNNLENGGIEFVAKYLPIMLTKVKKGAIFLAPLEWSRDKLLNKQYLVGQLTGDLSKGVSNHPMCYIVISPK